MSSGGSELAGSSSTPASYRSRFGLVLMNRHAAACVYDLKLELSTRALALIAQSPALPPLSSLLCFSRHRPSPSPGKIHAPCFSSALKFSAVAPHRPRDSFKLAISSYRRRNQPCRRFFPAAGKSSAVPPAHDQTILARFPSKQPPQQLLLAPTVPVGPLSWSLPQQSRRNAAASPCSRRRAYLHRDHSAPPRLWLNQQAHQVRLKVLWLAPPSIWSLPSHSSRSSAAPPSPSSPSRHDCDQGRSKL